MLPTSSPCQAEAAMTNSGRSQRPAQGLSSEAGAVSYSPGGVSGAPHQWDRL